MLTTAIDDLVNHRDAGSTGGRAAFYQAQAWICSDERRWPYSFLKICETLGLEASRVRTAALQRRDTIQLLDA